MAGVMGVSATRELDLVVLLPEGVSVEALISGESASRLMGVARAVALLFLPDRLGGMLGGRRGGTKWTCSILQ